MEADKRKLVIRCLSCHGALKEPVQKSVREKEKSLTYLLRPVYIVEETEKGRELSVTQGGHKQDCKTLGSKLVSLGGPQRQSNMGLCYAWKWG